MGLRLKGEITLLGKRVVTLCKVNKHPPSVMGTRNYTTKILWNSGCIYRIKVIIFQISTETERDVWCHQPKQTLKLSSRSISELQLPLLYSRIISACPPLKVNINGRDLGALTSVQITRQSAPATVIVRQCANGRGSCLCKMC